MPDIPAGDEWRAVIEDVEFRHHVVAKGGYVWTRDRLAAWLRDHPLPPLHTAYVLQVHTRIEGPPPPDPAIAGGAS